MATRTGMHLKLSYTERYEYDAADRVSAEYLPEGGTLSYRWGSGRQLLAIEHDNGRASTLLGQRLSQWLGWGRSIIIEPLAKSAESKH